MVEVDKEKNLDLGYLDFVDKEENFEFYFISILVNALKNGNF